MTLVKLDPMGVGPPEGIPTAPQECIDLAAARGWKVAADWSHEWTDPDDGVTYPGFWQRLIWRAGELPSGEQGFYALTADSRGNDSLEFWGTLLDLADMAWKDLCANHPAPSVGALTCPSCRGTGGGVYNDCPTCGGNGVV